MNMHRNFFFSHSLLVHLTLFNELCNNGAQTLHSSISYWFLQSTCHLQAHNIHIYLYNYTYTDCTCVWCSVFSVHSLSFILLALFVSHCHIYLSSLHTKRIGIVFCGKQVSIGLCVLYISQNRIFAQRYVLLKCRRHQLSLFCLQFQQFQLSRPTFFENNLFHITHYTFNF